MVSSRTCSPRFRRRSIGGDLGRGADCQPIRKAEAQYAADQQKNADSMGVNGDKPKTDNAETGGGQKDDGTPPFLKFCRWVVPSIRNPDNFPHYLIAAFTLGLAIFALFAWIESRRGTQALEGQMTAMREDQRPYIWITNDPLGVILNIPTGATAGTLLLTIKYTNYGRGVAFRFDRRLYIKVKNGPYKKALKTLPRQ
jgi:hypothetical protein